MDLIPYHKKSVLVIEDLAEMRASMKSMLGNMGVQSIESVNSGEEAMNKLRVNHYDIVLSDYELGRGKDGQQILEECRAANLIKAQTIFVLVTAAQTVEMVMGALEFEPDGYITKPVTLDILRTRLNKIIRTKDVYAEINRAIDNKDVTGALEACNRLAVERPRFALASYRIKGKVLLDVGRLQEARDIFETVLGIKRVAWAVLGMAKVLYRQGELEESRKLLEGLANSNAKFVEALDWLAKVLEAQGKYNAAQKVLETAVANSAKSVQRQQALARLAELNNDYPVMYRACRKAVGLGKNSFFNNPQMYIALAKSLQPKIVGGSLREQKLCITEAFSLLEMARTQFDLDGVSVLKASLVEAQTLFNSGKKTEGSLAYRAAQVQVDANPDLSLDDKLDILIVRLSFDDEATLKAYGDELLAQIKGDRRLENKYYSILENHLSEQPEERLALMKRRGEELMGRSNWEDAVDLYLRASELKNADTDVRIGAIKATIGLFASGHPDSARIATIDSLLSQLANLPESDARFPVVQRLQREWVEVTAVELAAQS
ncbi:CheY-like response regulator receiver [gamma proteobacterium HdN1]|nr:CheY-like response regulator receiver [gamma proteobacterium HdN1]